MIYKLASFLSIMVIYRKIKQHRQYTLYNNLQVIEFEDLWGDIC